VDRERVVQRLNRAHAEGRLDLLELDERLAAAYAAHTYGELEPLTADLPAPPPAAGDGSRSRRARAYAIALRIEMACWAFASVVNLVIWAIISLTTTEAVYPWWIWVAGPWGVVLLARIMGERLPARLRGRFSTRF
jgi:hypothetical protein